jgi:hypothetical protein
MMAEQQLGVGGGGEDADGARPIPPYSHRGIDKEGVAGF